MRAEGAPEAAQVDSSRESSAPFPAWTYSSYSVDALGGLITGDRSLFDTAALARIAERLGAGRHTYLFNPKPVLSPTYKFSGGLEKYHMFTLGLDSLAEGDSGAALYRIGVEASGGQDFWSSGATQAFLRSAYLEEVLPEYRSLTPEEFISLEPKSDREFWKRNLFSMGYAIQYLSEGNPFSPETHSSVKWGYLGDILVYGMLAGGLADGSGEYVLTALATGALFRVVWVGLKQAHMDFYNRAVASGYAVPRMAQYDSLQARAGERKNEVVWRGRMKRPAYASAAASRDSTETAGRQTVGQAASAVPGARPEARAYAVAPEGWTGKAETNPFDREEVPAKVTAGTKAGILLLSPMVGMLGGAAYGAVAYGQEDPRLLDSMTVGMLLGLGFGIRVVIGI